MKLFLIVNKQGDIINKEETFQKAHILLAKSKNKNLRVIEIIEKNISDKEINKKTRILI